MKKFYYAALCLIVLGCLNKKSSNLKSEHVVEYNDRGTMAPGVGYLFPFDDGAKRKCITHDPIELGQDAGQKSWRQLRVVNSHSALASEFGISHSSQIKASLPESNLELSQKTRFGFTSNFKVNKYSVFAVIKTVVENPAVSLKNVKINPEIVKGLMNKEGRLDLKKFRDECGDGYMASYTSGGEFFALLEIETKNSEDLKKLTAEFEKAAAVENLATVNQESKIEAVLTKTHKYHKMNINMMQFTKAGVNFPEESLENLIAHSRKLPELVKEPSLAPKVTATFVDYSHLLGNLVPEDNVKVLRKAQREMASYASALNSLRDQRDNITYVLSHEEFFPGMTAKMREEYEDKKLEIEDHISDVRDSAFECFEDHTLCDGGIKVKEIKLLVRGIEKQRKLSNYKLMFQITPTFINDKTVGEYFTHAYCYYKITVRDRSKIAPLIRTPSQKDCTYGGGSRTFSIDDGRFKDAIRNMNEDQVVIDISIYEEDSYWALTGADDFYGKMSISMNELKSGKKIQRQINNDDVIINIDSFIK